MKSKEILERQLSIRNELSGLITKDVSAFTEEERSLWITKHNEYEDLEKQLRIALEQEEMQRRSATQVSASEKKDFGRYSFRKAIAGAAGMIPFDGIEREMDEEARRESSALGLQSKGNLCIPVRFLANRGMNNRASTGQNVATNADGGYLVGNENPVYFEALQNAMVLSQLGTRYINGLQGNLPLNQGGSFTSSFLAEDGSSSVTKETFSQKVAQPHRLQASAAFSRQLLLQAVPAIDELIERDLIESNAHAIEAAAIAGSGSSNQPTGILNTSSIGSVAGGTDGLAPTWAHIVSLESAVGSANGIKSNPAYLTNFKVSSKLKTVDKSTSTAQFVYNGDGLLNGYKLAITNAVPSNLTKGSASGVCSAIIFGDFSNLYICSWGGLDILVNPYLLSATAEIRVDCTSYVDTIAQNPACWAAMQDALTA